MVKRWRERLRRWVLRKRKAKPSYTLDRNNLFIFPSGMGWASLFLAALLWLLGTNYENNLILALAFIVVSVFIVAILHTHNALSGLTIAAIKGQSCYVGEYGEIELSLSRKGSKPYRHILLRWDGENSVQLNLNEQQELRTRLFVKAKYRGRYRPPMLLIESFYPLGLMRCWAWIYFDIDLLAYPSPKSAGPMPKSSGGQASDEPSQRLIRGADNFSGFRPFQPGDSARQIAWKHYAQGKGLHSKEYQAYADDRVWVDWDDLPHLNREPRLQALCAWVLELSRGEKPYGLKLPGLEVLPGAGLQHKQDCLKALALFEFVAPEVNVNDAF